MTTLKFEDLYNAIVNEAPITSYLTRPTSQEYRNKLAAQAREMQRQEQEKPKPKSFLDRLGSATAAAMPSVKKGAEELGKGVGGVVGTAAKNIGKAALNAPSAVKTARNFLLGDDPAGMIKQGIQNFQDNRERSKAKKEAENSKMEEFEKDMVKSLLASQSAATSQTQQPQANQQTTSGAIQAPGTITGGNVQSTSGVSGTSSATMRPSITPSTQSNLLKRDPKTGDVFTVPDKFGRIKRYKINKVTNDTVQAMPVISR